MKRYILLFSLIVTFVFAVPATVKADPFDTSLGNAEKFGELAQFEHVRQNAPFYTCWTASNNFYIIAFDYPHYVGDLTITAFCQYKYNNASGSGFSLCCVMSDGSIIDSADSSIWYTFTQNYYSSSNGWSQSANTITPLTYSSLWSVSYLGVFNNIRYSNVPTFNSLYDIQLFIDSNFSTTDLILNRDSAKMQGFVSYDVSQGDQIINLDSVRVVNSSDQRDSYFIFDFSSLTNVNINDVYYDFTVTGTPCCWYNNSFLSLGANNFVKGNKYTKTINALHPLNSRYSVSFTDFYGYMNIGNPLNWQSSTMYKDDLNYSNWVIDNNDYDSNGVFTYSGLVSNLNNQTNRIAYVNSSNVIQYAYLTDCFITIQPYSIVNGSKVLFNSITVNMAGYSVVPFQGANTAFSISGNVQNVVTGNGTSVDNAITNSVQQTTIYLEKLDTDSIMQQYNNAFDNVKHVVVTFSTLFDWIPAPIWSVMIMTISAMGLIAIIKFIRG